MSPDDEDEQTLNCVEVVCEEACEETPISTEVSGFGLVSIESRCIEELLMYWLIYRLHLFL